MVGMYRNMHESSAVFSKTSRWSPIGFPRESTISEIRGSPLNVWANTHSKTSPIVTVSSSWNNELLEWREPELSKALYQDDYVITMDITGSYDFEARDGYHYSFEIVDEDGVPYFKNLERTYRGDNPYAKPKPFSVESALIEFKHSFGTECMRASCSSGSGSFGLSICYGSLYFVAPGWNETRIASID